MLRVGHPDGKTNVNSVTVQPARRISKVPHVAARTVADDPPLTRSSTQPRRSSRLDPGHKGKTVTIVNPRQAIKRVVGHKVPRHDSPPPRAVSPLSDSPSPPISPLAQTQMPPPVDIFNQAGTSAAMEAAGIAAREVRLDKDTIQIPMSFPTQDLGVPTPGTTNLNEPPEGELPPPPPLPSCFERPPGFPDRTRGALPPSLHVHAYSKIQSVQRLSEMVNKSVKELSEVLYTQCHASENPPPVAVVSIHNDDISV